MQGLHALKAADETQALVEALEATETELSAKVRLLSDHERWLTNKNRCLEHQIVVLKVGKKPLKACQSAYKRVVTNVKVELTNVNEALCSLEEQASADRLLMLSAVEDLNHTQDELTAASVKFQMAERVLTAAFDKQA